MTEKRLYEVSRYFTWLRKSDNGIGFLVYFESELLKRAHKNFSFLNGR